VKAAVYHAPHQPLRIESVQIDEPGPGEVLVRTRASGVCGSDVHIADGYMPEAAHPMVLGHEAAGVVEAVGPGVSYARRGDHVVISPTAWCGECEMCLRGHLVLCTQRPTRPAEAPPRLFRGSERIAQFTNVASFAEQMLVHERSLLVVDRQLPLESLSLIGCGVMTGLGAALHTVQLRAGDSVAVFGAGGVGLSAMQGAQIAGATTIIAVDLSAERLDIAQRLVATHTVNAAATDPVEAIRAIAPGGVDFAFEAIGSPKAAQQVFASVRMAGTAVLIGFFPGTARLDLPAADFLNEKKLVGSRMGSAPFRPAMRAYIELYKQGRLKLDELVTRRAKLEDVNDAFDAMRAGRGARTVLCFA
jgi:S-(hydroxymethyl)glutathione dehydrogenase/alcohol dehydrogenase